MPGSGESLRRILGAVEGILSALASAEPRFLEEHASEIEDILADASSRIAILYNKWRGAAPAAKPLRAGSVEEEIEAAEWKPSRSGEGEWVRADETPLLKEELEEAGGKKSIGGYAYYLSRSGRIITRYSRRKAGRARQQPL